MTAPQAASERCHSGGICSFGNVTPVSVETADTTERDGCCAGRAEGRDAGDGRDKAGRTACRDSEVEKLGMTDVQIAKKLGI